MLAHWRFENSSPYIVHELLLFVKKHNLIRRTWSVRRIDHVFTTVRVDSGNGSPFEFVPLFLILDLLVVGFISFDSTTKIRCWIRSLRWSRWSNSRGSGPKRLSRCCRYPGRNVDSDAILVPFVLANSHNIHPVNSSNTLYLLKMEIPGPENPELVSAR